MQIFPLNTRSKRESEKYIKSMSLQKTAFDEANHQILLGEPQPAAKEGVQGKDRSFEELVEAAIIKTKRYYHGYIERRSAKIYLSGRMNICKPV